MVNCYDDVEVTVKVNMYFWSFLDDIAMSRHTTVEEIVKEAIMEYIKKIFERSNDEC